MKINHLPLTSPKGKFSMFTLKYKVLLVSLDFQNTLDNCSKRDFKRGDTNNFF